MDAAPSHRADRLRRAWQLVKAGKVERLDATHCRVAGNVEESYSVDLNGDPMCYCRDMEHRAGQIKGMCKHVLACRLAALDDGLLDTIAEWMTVESEQQAATARRTTRRKESA